MGNPFTEESTNLLRMDTRDIMDPAVVSSVCQAEEIGLEQYKTFVNDRIVERSTRISEPIKTNKLSLQSAANKSTV